MGAFSGSDAWKEGLLCIIYMWWTHVELLHMKDEAFNAYTDFEAWAKTQFRVRSFKRLQTDRGGEYLSHKFNQHLAANGTKQILTMHDTPAYDGVAERLNCVLLEHPSIFPFKRASKIALGRSGQTHHLAKEQNSNLHTPKWQNTI